MKHTFTALLTVAAAVSCNIAAFAGSDRISTSDFVKDPAKVAVLQKAVATMRTNDTATNTGPAFLASWQYWANTHGYLGIGPNAAGTVATYVPEQIALRCSGDSVCINYYKHLSDTPMPADSFTSKIWGTCQHGNLNFLPWHRMYLHFFERVMRKQSGDVNFSLPYWDYFAEKGARGKGIALPTLVRGKSAGAMYDRFRTPGLNEYKTAIAATTGSAVQAFKFTDFTPFSNQLENQPHGVMHCGTGSGCRAPDMGLVPLAGLDPVFYMHHANIDRLWQCWLNRKANGQPINLAWAKANLGMPDDWYQTSYSFVDENGKAVSLTIADVFTPGVIDAHYDNDSNCVVAEPRTKSLAFKAMSPTLINITPVSHRKGAVLKGKALTIPLQVSTDKNLLLETPKTKGAKPGNALLIIENVDIHGDPEVTYNIYISSKRDPKRSVYIATLNYFGLIEPTHQGHQQNSGPQAKIGTLTYDVQEELMELGVASTADVAIRFVPSNFISEVVKKRTTTGSVTVGNIRLEQAGGAEVK